MKELFIYKLRELIQAEIASNAEATEEDENGYRGCSNRESRNADKVFNELLLMTEKANK